MQLLPFSNVAMQIVQLWHFSAEISRIRLFDFVDVGGRQRPSVLNALRAAERTAQAERRLRRRRRVGVLLHRLEVCQRGVSTKNDHASTQI